MPSTTLLRILLLVAFSLSLPAGSIYGGLEDLPGGGPEGNGDYNDMMFRMDGDVRIFSPGSLFRDLQVIHATGGEATFWDGLSTEAWNTNVGFCLLGTGACDVSERPDSGIQYLAGDRSQAAWEVVFEALGPVTITMLGERAGLKDLNTLGWYDPENPGVRHSIFAGLDGPGATFTFQPGGRFVLFSTNGLGQVYSSIAADNQNEPGSYQHFAFFQATPPTPNPEPGTLLLGAVGFALLTLGKCRIGKG